MERLHLKRHDLVWFPDASRKAMYSRIAARDDVWPEEEVRRLVVEGYGGVQVPGIVRRQDAGDEGLGIGLASPFHHDGMRIRVAASIRVSEIERVLDPISVAGRLEEVEHRDLPVFRALGEVLKAARSSGVTCGVFGSAALELVTGLPYCHDDSDVDVTVRYEDLEATSRFHGLLCGLEGASGVRVDAELELCDGSAVKLKEFFSSSDSVLVKGFNDVRLRARDEVAVKNYTCPYRYKERCHGSEEQGSRQDPRDQCFRRR